MTADAASCCTLATFILTLENSEPKIWVHIEHCLSSAKAIPIQETQKLHCVDAAASDAENLCRWCLASPVDIFWKFLFRSLWNASARRVQYATHVLFSHSTVEKKSYSWHRNQLQIGNVYHEFSLLVKILTTLRRKIIQRSIFFESDLFSSSDFLHV